MLLPKFLVQDSDGFIRLTGHRIGLHHIVRRYRDGYSPEMLLGEFPTLALAHIHKTIAVYLENRAEIDALLAEIDEEVRMHEAASPSTVTFAELRHRTQMLHQAAC